jgi:hypothetical protein
MIDSVEDFAKNFTDGNKVYYDVIFGGRHCRNISSQLICTPKQALETSANASFQQQAAGYYTVGSSLSLGSFVATLADSG